MQYQHFLTELHRAWQIDDEKKSRSIEEEIHITKLILTLQNNGLTIKKMAEFLDVTRQRVSAVVTAVLQYEECDFDRTFKFEDPKEHGADKGVSEVEVDPDAGLGEPDEKAIRGALREMHKRGLMWTAEESQDNLHFYLGSGILLARNYNVEAMNSEKRPHVFIRYIQDKTRAGEKLVLAEEKVEDLVETIQKYEHLLLLRNHKIMDLEDENVYLSNETKGMQDNYQKLVTRVEAMEQGFVMGQNSALLDRVGALENKIQEIAA